MSANESILRTTLVAELISPGLRDAAYNIEYVLAWFAGIALIGALYDASSLAATLFSLLLQASAVLIFLRVGPLAR
jgi:hypothetical protein